MKSRVGIMLDRGGRKAYENWLLAEICAVEALAPFHCIHPLELLRHGTPFFWMNVHRLSTAANESGRRKTLPTVLMTGFDSYFHLLPDDACVPLGNAESHTIALPNLGITIHNLSHVTLRRVSPDRIGIESKTGTSIVNLTPAVRSWPRVIALPESAVTTPDMIDNLSDGDIQAFSNRVLEALTLIELADDELYQSIRELIRWFVPLRKPLSARSAKELIGVVHVPEDYSGIRLCESIVHEFHHNELFVLETTQKLAHHQRAVFYSPWRTEPRPLSGLLHGLQSFLGVARFFGRIQVRKDLSIVVHRRRVEDCRKLRLCIDQIPESDLTPLGIVLLRGFADDLKEQEQELGV